MTEDQAKQKWCPMVRFNDRNSETAYNAWYDTSGGEGRCKCIGSACMMWRWDAITPEEKRQLREYGDSTGPLLAIPGYCGLAGKL